jgi:murein DD-endopeptidase MepM/ murein hydrolase activator NlpD
VHSLPRGLPPPGRFRNARRVFRSRVLPPFLALLIAAVAVLAGPGLLVPAAAAPPAAVAPPGAVPALWGWPLAGSPTVSRPFDAPPTPYAAGHRGADLLGAVGQPVLSAGAGVVAFAGTVAGRPVVSVQHAGGLRTTYEPVQPVVAAGQPVARGSPIGVLVAGHPGCPVQACLHWGLRRGDVYLDPLLLLRPPRVRLLPWG